MVNDDVFEASVLGVLGNRALIGLWAAVALGPLLFFWGLYEHWRKRRRTG